MSQWTGEVTTENRGPNRVIRLANGKRNLLNPGVMAAMVEALEAARDDTTVQGVILTGEGDVFCGGLDVPAIQAGADPIEFAKHLVALLKIFPSYPKPIVAAVNGDAVASGASIAASADFGVCSEIARVGTYEVSVNVWPMIAQVPVIKAIGVKRAMENIGAGEPFSAQRAYEVGLVNQVVAVGDELPAAEAWLDKAHRGLGVYAVGRPTAYEYDAMAIDDALDASLNKFISQF
jgi:enoyl-CoA hydratase/carnithine racemase